MAVAWGPIRNIEVKGKERRVTGADSWTREGLVYVCLCPRLLLHGCGKFAERRSLLVGYQDKTVGRYPSTRGTSRARYRGHGVASDMPPSVSVIRHFELLQP
jgi:hypothetical protein